MPALLPALSPVQHYELTDEQRAAIRAGTMTLMDILGDGTQAKSRSRKAPEPKKGNPEHLFQMRVKQHLTPILGAPGIRSRLGVYWYAMDSAHNKPRVAADGTKYDLEGQARKARGCVRGPSDLVFTWPGRSAGYIELKAGVNKPSDEQDKFLEAMTANGWHVAVIWDREGVEAVERKLRDWGAPFYGRTMA